MLSGAKSAASEIIFLHKAVMAWLLSAAVLVASLTCAVYFAGLSAGFVGYACSAMSFLCSLCAGAAARRARGGGALSTGLITGAAVTIALLTVGFIVEGSALEASGVMSVASFSITGAAAGSVFFGGGTGNRRKKTHRKGKK